MNKNIAEQRIPCSTSMQKKKNKIYDDIVYLSLATYNFAFTSVCD